MEQSRDLILSHQTRFIQELDQHNVFSSQRLQDAFRHIPRDQFLDQIYVRGEDGQWKSIQRPVNDVEMAESRWLPLVYSDQALVTRIDQEGIPICSSSQPSVMAWMLSALDVQPGHNVLEIGTGQGYNAGLLAFLTHDSTHVTTIDVDPILIRNAATRLHAVLGSGLQTCVGNGLDGYPENAPYDRIIATASYHTIPVPLFQQLKPGGILVMNLRGELAGAFLTVKKQEDGTAIGTIKNLPRVAFMTMRHGNIQNGTTSTPPDHLLERHEIPTEVLPPEVFKDRDFLFYLQWAFQTATYYWQSVTIGEHGSLQPRFVDQTSASLLKWFPSSKLGYQIVDEYGGTHLLQHLIDAYDHFRSAGSPPPEYYVVSIDHAGRSEIILRDHQAWHLKED